MITTVLFDLDGTLSDSFAGISNGILYALKKMGYEAPSRESLKCFVGPPLFDQFKRSFKMNDENASEAVRLYREYYSAKGIFEQTLVDKAEETLKTLKSLGKTICLATSKPQEYAEKILKLLNIEKYFDEITGAAFDGSISEKSQVIALALKKVPAALDECLMVGDRFYDVEGAHKCGIKCAGVLCGFGSLKELDSCGADYIVNTVYDIIKATQ